MTADPAQTRVLAHGRGPLLVTGPPGTGKTWVLRERYARLVEAGEDPERIALFTLTRRAAREAREWLARRLGRSLPDLPVFTAHGFAFRTVGRRFRELAYPAPPVVLSAPEQYAVVRDLLAGERAEDWPTYGPLLRTRPFVREVADFVLRAQERLLDPEALARRVAEVGCPEYRELAGFYGRYLDALAQSGQVDFGGLLFQTVALLRRGLQEGERFRHVLVDDYQDATPASEAIVAALAAAASTVVVAADPEGNVFGYRGGTREPLDRVGEVLGVRERVALETPYRLGDRLGAVVALGREARPPLPGGGGAPPVPSPAAGVEARVLAHPGEEVEAVAHELLRARVDEDVRWGEMAVVLRRYGPYLTALRHALGRHGIPFVVVAESAELPAEPAVRPLVDLLRYVFRPGRREELLEPLLTSPVGGLDAHGVRWLRRTARQRELSLRELVESRPDVPLPPDLRGRVEAFRSLLADLARRAPEAPPDEVFFELWQRLPHFRALVEAEGSGDGGGRDLDALAAFGDTLSRFAERRPGATIVDYLEALEAAEFGPDPWLSPEERHPEAVRVVSAHLAQGMEFEVVLVAGCLEGEFPSLAGPEPTVSLQRLLSPSSPRERLGERLAEERRLFRLAVSRARRRTVLFASRSTGSRSPRTPSRFAAWLGLAWAPPTEPGPPTSLRTMEAELRRVLADRGASPARRLAAVAALASVGARPDRWWGCRAWTDPGVPLYPEEIRTSYSRLTIMDNCGLQYLYSVEMGLDPETTYQMWLGTVVHSIIDRVHRGEVEATPHGLRRALDQAWRPDVFPNQAVEHRRYLDARDMLERWLNYERRDALRSEVAFEFPLDGAVLRGRIDAIFRQENGRLRVVDYKTGRTVPSQEEARRDLQLASYYLALRRAPELRALGEPGILQLAFLGRAHAGDGFVRRQVAPNTVEDYEGWAERAIAELLERIRREDFAPSPEADCQFCAFRTICPRWPEGQEVPVLGLGSRPASAGPEGR
ncbi:MAG TPA: ATP-dependent DNA helicase [Actinomycetota bacterium]|nr:ATP-dependent DNA helicase [Actinomycetota bacterium]